MRIKFNVFLSVLSLLIGSLFFYSCSDDTPNVDEPETEQPGDSEDNADNSDFDNESNQSAVNVPSSESLDDNTVSITYTGKDV